MKNHKLKWSGLSLKGKRDRIYLSGSLKLEKWTIIGDKIKSLFMKIEVTKVIILKIWGKMLYFRRIFKFWCCVALADLLMPRNRMDINFLMFGEYLGKRRRIDVSFWEQERVKKIRKCVILSSHSSLFELDLGQHQKLLVHPSEDGISSQRVCPSIWLLGMPFSPSFWSSASLSWWK